MPLQFQQHVKTNLPINVEGICPATVCGLSSSAVGNLCVFHGNEKVSVVDLFAISGSANDDDTIHFSGELNSVNGIGARLGHGTIIVDGDVGRHVGSYMTGGEIVVRGNVSDFLGMAMTGGEIRVTGSAGDHVGANFPGASAGMNRGTILISGNVGSGCGQAMRRGTIVVGGNAGALAGWNMNAGTLVVFGETGDGCGTNMKRGTIILGNPEKNLSTMFVRGEKGQPMVIRILARWLNQQALHWPDDRLGILSQPFQQFHGDQLAGGRGEIFVRCGD